MLPIKEIADIFGQRMIASIICCTIGVAYWAGIIHIVSPDIYRIDGAFILILYALLVGFPFSIICMGIIVLMLKLAYKDKPSSEELIILTTTLSGSCVVIWYAVIQFLEPTIHLSIVISLSLGVAIALFLLYLLIPIVAKNIAKLIKKS